LPGAVNACLVAETGIVGVQPAEGQDVHLWMSERPITHTYVLAADRDGVQQSAATRLVNSLSGAKADGQDRPAVPRAGSSCVRPGKQSMNWKYYIPHVWDTPRTVWEDIYLLPDVPDPEPQSIWLTIDALGDAADLAHGSERAEFQRIALARLGDREFWIDGAEMIVRARDFSQEELLGWARVWLTEQGLPVAELVETPVAAFAGTNGRAALLGDRSQCEEVRGSRAP
jgi:hypothetical protein